MASTRRDLLKFSATSAAAFGLTAIKPGLAMGRMPLAGDATKKMLIIFGRGANDALNTIIPHGDPGYDLSRDRGTIGDIAFTPAGQTGPRNSIAIPGVTFAEAHPALADLINGGPWTSRDLAFLHAVGSPFGNRSHFTEMNVIEAADAPPGTGRPRRDGWVNRLGDALYTSSTMRSVSLSSRIQTLFVADALGTNPKVDTHIQRVFSKNFNGGSLATQNNHGAAYDGIAYSLNKTGSADAVAEMLRQGLASAAGAPHTSDEDRLVRQTWERFLDSEATVEALTGYTHDAKAFPANPVESASAGIPGPLKPNQYAFMQRMEEATILLNNTDTQVVGVELGGFDTHQTQLPDHEKLLRTLSRGMKSAYEALGKDTLIFFVTEFGRTNRVNGSEGTDHGVGGLYIALGSGVKGGLYNCHNGGGLGNAWQNLPTNSTHPDYDYNAIKPATDFRALYQEILFRHFGITNSATIDTIVPPWTPTTPSEAVWLDFLL